MAKQKPVRKFKRLRFTLVAEKYFAKVKLQDQKDMNEASLSIAAGIRWLHRKRETARGRSGLHIISRKMAKRSRSQTNEQISKLLR